MYFLYIKALHIIFIVTWFAGLFYIVRLFVYYAEADLQPSPQKEILKKQYQLMQKRLWYGITWPSAILTAIFGTLLALYYGSLPLWLILKLCLVAGLYVYHFLCHRIFTSQQNDQMLYTAQQMRIWNEVATILLVGIVFLVVLKNTLSLLWGLAGLAVFTIVLLLAIKLYKYLREKNNN
jgi:putative membrane protein